MLKNPRQKISWVKQPSIFRIPSRQASLMVRTTAFLTLHLLLNELWLDWVSLDVDGVVRGDIYLEMTYYANAPAPTAAPKNKLLAPAQGSALGRRPSKLSPSDRLSHPIQQNAAGPSSFYPRQPSRLHDQFNSTSSHLNNAVSPTRTNDSSLDLPANEPVHTSTTLLNTRHHRSSSLPQAIQPALVPSILRPGLGGRSSTPDVSFTPPSPNPYIGGSSAYTPVQSGLSNIDGTSSNPHRRGSDAYIVEQQASGGRTYSPAPPGAFISGNQPAPDGRSYSHASRVASPNPYAGSGAFIPGSQQHQAFGGRTYSPTVSVQVSGPYPSPVSPANPYIGSGGVYSPENQLGSNVSSYSPAPATTPVQISMSSSIGHSAPTNPYTGGMAPFIPGSQQAPDGWVYSSSPPVDVPQIVGHENYVPSLQANGPSPPYNAGTGPSGNVSSGPLTFPMPMIPVMEPYEPSSSHYQPPLPPHRTSSLRNNRSTGEIDPYHLTRYQTPLPLPPGSVKEGPLPPLPLPPPPPPVTPAQVSSSPPVAVTRSPVPDTARVEALRKVEQDATRRKEQELKDLELAMQLDRELNL